MGQSEPEGERGPRVDEHPECGARSLPPCGYCAVIPFGYPRNVVAVLWQR